MKTHWALIPTVTLSGFMSCACRLVQATAPTLPQLQKRSLFIVMALCGLNVSISQQHRMQDFDWELYFPFSCPVCSLAGGEIELCVLVESWGGGLCCPDDPGGKARLFAESEWIEGGEWRGTKQDGKGLQMNEVKLKENKGQYVRGRTKSCSRWKISAEGWSGWKSFEKQSHQIIKLKEAIEWRKEKRTGGGVKSNENKIKALREDTERTG